MTENLKSELFNLLNEDYLVENEIKYKVDSKSLILNGDCFNILNSLPDNSLEAIVTDPPYGVKEYDLDQIQKMKNGYGGIWRIPPSFDGNKRSPLPRFTALNEKELKRLKSYFEEFGKIIGKKLKPGGHAFIASNSFLSVHVFNSIMNDNLQFRTEIIRLVRTMRGGDKPKNFENEFSEICSLPRGCYEPWGLFRKPLPKKMTVGECLRTFGTGGLRRISEEKPFEDVIQDSRTPKKERDIANHPSLKPQSFLRKLVYSALPLGEGVVMDPFMGSGSTISAAKAVGYSSIGVERDIEYFKLAAESINSLKRLTI